MPRIVFISDTHLKLKELTIPKGDILIHSGDATFQGKTREIVTFNEELETIKNNFKRIVFVPGNHDFGFQNNAREAIPALTNATDILIDKSVTIDGLKIYGSPWQPWFYDWAFNFYEFDAFSGGTQAQYKWSQIPDDTDILVTHGPPHGILDEVLRHDEDKEHVGCPWLLKRVEAVKPKIHAFGHIHEGYGRTTINETMFINASSCNEEYKAVNAPIVIDL